MSQPTSHTDGLPAMGTVPLGPDEPELFTDAMERILRHLGQKPAGRRAAAKPGRQAGHPSDQTT